MRSLKRFFLDTFCEDMMNRSGLKDSQNATVVQIMYSHYIFIYIAQMHNHNASVGITICSVNNILCPLFR